jgi:hypothetical protein
MKIKDIVKSEHRSKFMKLCFDRLDTMPTQKTLYNWINGQKPNNVYTKLLKDYGVTDV